DELPDAALLHELILVDPFAPLALATDATGHVELAAADARRQAVAGYRDDGLQLDVIVEPAGFKTLLAQCAEEGAHAFPADVDALLRELDRAVVGEQVGELIPLRAVEVVAVDPLQVLD